jgi:hypothetical protein
MTTEAFPTNINLGWKQLNLTKTISYNGAKLIRNVKGFIIKGSKNCI